MNNQRPKPPPAYTGSKGTYTFRPEPRKPIMPKDGNNPNYRHKPDPWAIFSRDASYDDPPFKKGDFALFYLIRCFITGILCGLFSFTRRRGRRR